MSTDTLNFLPIEKITSGVGALREVSEKFAGSRVCLVTSRSLHRNLAGSGEFEALTTHAGAVDTVFAQAHVPADLVEELAASLQATTPDYILGIGGGSVFDLIKAALAQVSDAGRRRPSFVAVPTTLSGAEFAHFYGVTVTEDGTTRKKSFVRSDVVANEIVLDGEWARHTPDQLWVSTGLKALDHAVEAFIATGPNVFLEELLLGGIRRMSAALRQEASEPSVDNRQRALVAAWHCYPFPASMTLGLSHRIGHALGGRFHVSHGLTSGVALPAVMDAVHRSGAVDLSRIAQALAGGGDPGSQQAGALMRALVSDLGLPTTLTQLGLEGSDVDILAEEVAREFPDSLAVLGPEESAASRRERLQQLLVSVQ
ncbi:iron-containing alcohol dehydrogenase [Corynebacterium nasicanis]|uniref:Iron-containing alcohol dehydrogenase n=1 Tax=Corynebacterium nasicanis TaxID=1448267 RepID=A0ABW1QEF3_9CORY